ncbi:MAG: UvrD-helicase domain-containing protein [Pyrinomonadaceae bacterium]|nr:UvrD-helicase domain-containing protein [Pyrinomonadaceae bacterium]
MSHWQKIRDAANYLRQEICAASNLGANALIPANDFVTVAAEYLELDLIPEHPASNNLQKALAVLEDDCVYFNNHLKKWYRAFCIAHEIGHHVLHHQSVHCSLEEISDLNGETDLTSATEKIVGYGAGMRREREANLFALEFLLPCELLKKLYSEEHFNARQLGEQVEMPPEVVASQLARALLVPSGERKIAAEEHVRRELDASQKRAAETVNCPTLVYAGPGTGKTQTLTHRIAHLIEKGVEPKRILALTFSNKAAEEMRHRIGVINESAAALEIQVMTFHAYGLDILRTFYEEANLENNSSLLDKIDALLHLEANLHRLELEHYQNLHEPTQNLAAILGAISRAKDELCSPEEYRRLAEKMLEKCADSDDEEAQTKARKVLETARIYEYYESFLRDKKLLDFGDLVYRAVKLLQENAEVKREVRARYDAILVDEFQDVNRACGVLLKEIAGDGQNLWTVGDLRQSIYRWRGASPANINLFGVDFPDAETVSLETNYRSRTEIVETFSRFAGKMQMGNEEIFGEWKAQRGTAQNEEKTAVKFVIADTLDAEGAFIAERIEHLRENENLRYKDCAIICRTHSQLNKFAKILSAKNIPVFYLGELFEREEVRDLLALLDLKINQKSHSLIRVARFPEYRIPLADSRRIIQAQKENDHTFAEVLRDEEFTKMLSPKGKISAEKLLKHLTSSEANVSAWSFLAHYLFGESAYLKTLFAEDDVNNQSKRLAVYQLLRLAQSLEERFSKGENTPIAELLIYVKKLAHFNEDKNYAQIPTEAENLDAVRLLTVHSAKGLEFPAVFLPYLGKGKIPSNRKPQICPNPDEMIAGEADFHEAEEECLFFVASSRARDFLYLSRANDYSKNHSRFLEMLEGVLPPPETIFSSGEDVAISIAETTDEPVRREFYAAELDRYLRCGRDYYYAKVLGLKSAGEKSVYVKFHGCVYDTLRSLQTIRQMESVELNETNALARLDEFWRDAEIDAHSYAPIYRARAEEIVRRICRRLENSASISPNEIARPTYEVKLKNGTVKVQLDAVEIIETNGAKAAVIRKYKTGKSPQKPATGDADVLMKAAVQNHFPTAEAVLHKIFLSDDIVQEINITTKVTENRLKKYEDAIDGINRKIFEPSPGDNCPHCPHFFICPSGD